MNIIEASLVKVVAAMSVQVIVHSPPVEPSNPLAQLRSPKNAWKSKSTLFFQTHNMSYHPHWLYFYDADNEARFQYAYTQKFQITQVYTPNINLYESNCFPHIEILLTDITRRGLLLYNVGLCHFEVMK